MDKKEETIAQVQANPLSSPDVWPNGREFEIEVYDLTIDDNTGKQIPQRVSYKQPVIIKVFSKAELNSKLALYKSCDQIARIIREIPNSSTPPNQPLIAQTPQIKQQNVQAPSIAPQISAPQQKKSSAQYFKIGDIEIKIEDGQSYQKQFVKLTDIEASNIRIVDDKTNRVINLNGKHIEMKKWIQVQSSSTDELSTLEENISDKKD